MGQTKAREDLVSSLTLNETLRSLGFHHRPAPSHHKTGLREIVQDHDNKVVFTGRACDVWKWLHRKRLC